MKKWRIWRLFHPGQGAASQQKAHLPLASLSESLPCSPNSFIIFIFHEVTNVCQRGIFVQKYSEETLTWYNPLARQKKKKMPLHTFSQLVLAKFLLWLSVVVLPMTALLACLLSDPSTSCYDYCDYTWELENRRANPSYILQIARMFSIGNVTKDKHVQTFAEQHSS